MINFLFHKRNNSHPRSIILMYHRINNVLIDPWNLSVAPDNFSSHLEILFHKTDVVPISDMTRLQPMRSGRPRVVISFDDGYADNHELAVPILLKCNAPAVFYITTGYIDQRECFWWEQLQKIILENPLLPAVLNLEIMAQNFHFSFENEEILNMELSTEISKWKAFAPSTTKRSDCFFQLWKLLKPISHHERSLVLKDLNSLLGPFNSQDHDDFAMTSDQIKNISLNPIFTIGAHTVTHPSLVTLPKNKQRIEISESKYFLEQVTCGPIGTFAYPFGDYNKESIRSLREAGFSTATTTSPCHINKTTNPLEMGRFQVNNLNSDQFERALDNWLS